MQQQHRQQHQQQQQQSQQRQQQVQQRQRQHHQLQQLQQHQQQIFTRECIVDQSQNVEMNSLHLTSATASVQNPISREHAQVPG